MIAEAVADPSQKQYNQQSTIINTSRGVGQNESCGVKQV